MKTFLPLDAGNRLGRGRAWLAAGAVAALAASGIAVADSGPAATTSVAATFFANTVADSHSQTCTGANNDSIQVTSATFTGTAASSDAHLNGPVTIRVRSVYDATTNLGSLTGDVRVDNTSTSPATHFRGRLTAVDANGTVQGFLSGNEDRGVHLLGNVSATFSSTGGFSSSGTPGTIGGSGTGTDTAIVTSGSCDTPPAPAPSAKPFPKLHSGGFGRWFKASKHHGR